MDISEGLICVAALSVKSRNIRNTLIQILVQYLNMLDNFLLCFIKIKSFESFIKRKSQLCFSEVNLEKIDIQCRNGITCTIYERVQVNLLRLQIRGTIDENILIEHGSYGSVTHPFDVMVGSAYDVVQENVKRCPD